MTSSTDYFTQNASKHRLGCFRDSSDRDLSMYNTRSSRMTADVCEGICRNRGASYFGLQVNHLVFTNTHIHTHGLYTFNLYTIIIYMIIYIIIILKKHVKQCFVFRLYNYFFIPLTLTETK